MVEQLKAQVRKVLAVVLWHGWYKRFRYWDCDRQGQPLLDGITAVVSARNEAYIIHFCLESLVGVVDQVVCIDNGSDDGTLQVMEAFKARHSGTIRVDVLNMPGALLGDCRNAGLAHTRHKWHLRWDADMVCHTTGPNDMRQIRQVVLTNDRPRTIQLPRTNLRGDLHHTRQREALDPGEPILMRFGAHVRYVEYGKFDAIRVPFYYAMVKDSHHFYFHCEGLKPASNLVHRRQYFEWREAYNAYTDADRPEHVQTKEKFMHQWNLKFWGIDEELPLQWRFMRDFASKLSKVDTAIFGDYPAVLHRELADPKQRFEVSYRDGKPYHRIDRNDAALVAYVPTPADLAWESERFGVENLGG